MITAKKLVCAKSLRESLFRPVSVCILAIGSGLGVQAQTTSTEPDIFTFTFTPPAVDIPTEDGGRAIVGTPGIDTLLGSSLNDSIMLLQGDDIAVAGDGDDEVIGGGGHDIIYGGAGNDELSGNRGQDVIYGGTGNDIIEGGRDNDDLYGDEGNDEIYGERGDDWIEGGDGNDIIDGMMGNDELFGGLGDDTIEGGQGSDWVDGGDGDDTITGGAGNDVLIGGAGYDTLIMLSDDLSLGVDTISEFEAVVIGSEDQPVEYSIELINWFQDFWLNNQGDIEFSVYTNEYSQELIDQIEYILNDDDCENTVTTVRTPWDWVCGNVSVTVGGKCKYTACTGTRQVTTIRTYTDCTKSTSTTTQTTHGKTVWRDADENGHCPAKPSPGP